MAFTTLFGVGIEKLQKQKIQFLVSIEQEIKSTSHQSVWGVI